MIHIKKCSLKKSVFILLMLVFSKVSMCNDLSYRDYLVRQYRKAKNTVSGLGEYLPTWGGWRASREQLEDQEKITPSIEAPEQLEGAQSVESLDKFKQRLLSGALPESLEEIQQEIGQLIRERSRENRIKFGFVREKKKEEQKWFPRAAVIQKLESQYRGQEEKVKLINERIRGLKEQKERVKDFQDLPGAYPAFSQEREQELEEIAQEEEEKKEIKQLEAEVSTHEKELQELEAQKKLQKRQETFLETEMQELEKEAEQQALREGFKVLPQEYPQVELGSKREVQAEAYLKVKKLQKELTLLNRVIRNKDNIIQQKRAESVQLRISGNTARATQIQHEIEEEQVIVRGLWRKVNEIKTSIQKIGKSWGVSSTVPQ